jgi:hypothetical protein
LRTPDVGAVVVSTGEHEHMAPVLQALECGKAVLVDRPIALELEDASRILDALEASQGSVRVGYSRRLKRRYLSAREQIKQGRIGKVPGVSARLYNTRAQLYQMRRMDLFWRGEYWNQHGPRSVSARSDDLHAYKINRCVIAPAGHLILRNRRPTLSELEKYRLIAYDRRFSRRRVERAFEAANIVPRIALRATDADIMKTCVAAELGIAVIPEMAIDPKSDLNIRAVHADHLFPASRSCIILCNDRYLRAFLYDFIAMIAPDWTCAEVESARRRNIVP